MNYFTTVLSIQCAQSELDIDAVRTILAEYRIVNADITLRYDANADDLIDVIEGNRYVSKIIDSIYSRKYSTSAVYE